jgi:electron transfer flavoprotein alpha subunit
MSVLAVLEQRAGAWHRMSFETLAAAQQIAGELGVQARAAVLAESAVGEGIGALTAELAQKQLEKVYAVSHPLLKEYTPDGYTTSLRQ